jgi:hypothetical protein
LQRRSQLAEQLAEQLADGTRSARTTVTADPAAMMMVVRISLRRLSLHSLILEVLLDRGKILLRRREIPGS